MRLLRNSYAAARTVAVRRLRCFVVGNSRLVALVTAGRRAAHAVRSNFGNRMLIAFLASFSVTEGSYPLHTPPHFEDTKIKNGLQGGKEYLASRFLFLCERLCRVGGVYRVCGSVGSMLAIIV
jgi:hypothetical protein